MSPETLRASFAAIGNDGLWRTNPVHCITEWLCGPRTPSAFGILLRGLAAQGVSLPPEAVDTWRRRGQVDDATFPSQLVDEVPCPGVIGLAVERVGFVVPLAPAAGVDGWQVDGSLPFRPADVQDGLAALVRESGVPPGAFVPELCSYAFDNPLGRAIRGDSMTVAAVLAVVGRLAGVGAALLRAAVALVQFGPSGTLQAVEGFDTKLEAAFREIGRLSLAVVPRGVRLDRHRVETVWEVSSVAELAERLAAAGLLAPVLSGRGPLTRAETHRVVDRMRHLVRVDHRYRDAADLADRVRACRVAAPAEAGPRVELSRLHAEATRHHGRYAEAVRVSREAWEEVSALGGLGCDDDEADAAAEYAASLFSGHRFDDIPPLLGRWAAATCSDPRRFRPLTRVKVWNTLARGLAVLDQDGWQEWFGRSLDLGRRSGDADTVARTAHYAAHAHLRRGAADAAWEWLRQRPGSDFPRAGDCWDAFLRAKLACLEHERWADDGLERRLRDGETPYPAWLYLVATSRQQGWEIQDVVARLGDAARLLRLEGGGVEGNVCRLFACFIELYAAAVSGDVRRWAAGITGIIAFLAGSTDHASYYANVVGRLPQNPDLASAEAVLDRVPYF